MKGRPQGSMAPDALWIPKKSEKPKNPKIFLFFLSQYIKCRGEIRKRSKSPESRKGRRGRKPEARKPRVCSLDSEKIRKNEIPENFFSFPVPGAAAGRSENIEKALSLLTPPLPLPSEGRGVPSGCEGLSNEVPQRWPLNDDVHPPHGVF